MGRPKKNAELDKELEEIEGIDSDILKEYQIYITNAEDIVNEEDIIISISPANDAGLGGGVPMGGGLIFNGDEKTGKTTTALQLAENAQNNEKLLEICDGNVHVFYHDIEHRLKKMNVAPFKKLTPKNFHHIAAKRGHLLTAEQQLTMAEKLIADFPYSIHIIDSFSILSSEAELTEGMDKQQRADIGKIVGKFCRKIVQPLRVNKCLLIGMTWNMANPSGYGAPKTEKAPGALKYIQDTKMMVKNTEPWIESSKRVGQIINWKILNSALGGIPGTEVQSYLRYGSGLDNIAEIISLGVQLGLINYKKEGGRYNLEYLEQVNKELSEKKFHFKDLRVYLEENQQLQQELYQNILSMV